MFSIWKKKKGSDLVVGSSCKGIEDDGLRSILTKISDWNSNVVVIVQVKPIFLFNHQKIRSFLPPPPSSSDVEDHYCYSNCYLKSCHLCHKALNLDKEIYMYMGDLGFCSVECRERQIYLDETKEMEISTQRILATFRRRRNRDGGGGGRCETSGLLEDYRRRRQTFSSQESRVIFS